MCCPCYFARSIVDMFTIERAKEIFGENNVMENIVKYLERLKASDVTGVTNNDMHDRKAHQVFLDVVDDLESMLLQFEEAGKYE